MERGYDEIEFRQIIKKNMLSDVERLYQNDCLDCSGTTLDTKQLYTEVGASEVLNNIDCLDKISILHRTSYRIPSHQNREIPKSYREEERIAITMLKKSQRGLLKDNGFGRVFDYQVPLKRTQKDKGVGKIDLVSISKDGKQVFLLELKRPKSDDSMLHCVLEAYTYFKQLDFVKFKEDYSDICAPDAAIVPAPLVFWGGWQHKEYLDNQHPYLHKLMKKLGNIEPFFYTLEDTLL